MTVQLLNQIVKRGKADADKYERKRSLDKDLWNTAYLTDIPIEMLTDDAEQEISHFVDRHFGEFDVVDISIERNGMFRLWQFSVVTGQEITEYSISD